MLRERLQRCAARNGSTKALLVHLLGSRFAYRLARALRSAVRLRDRGKDAVSSDERKAEQALQVLGELTWRRRIQEFGIRSNVLRPIQDRLRLVVHQRWIEDGLARIFTLMVADEGASSPRLFVLIRARKFRDGVAALRLLRRSGVPIGAVGLALGETRVEQRAAVAVDAAELVLVTEAVACRSSDWLQRLVAVMVEEPTTAAVQPAIAGPEDRASALGFDLVRGKPTLVPVPAQSDAQGSEVSVIDSRCVLLRPQAFHRAPADPAWHCSSNILAASITALRDGNALRCIPVAVRVSGPRPAIDEVLPTLGPFLRRRILLDLVDGGGLWCRRQLRVSTSVLWAASACGRFPWELVDEGDSADVQLVGRPPDDREELDGVLRVVVDPQHDEGHALCTRIRQAIRTPSFCLHLPVRDAESAVAGGDLYLASALARSLRRLGRDASVRLGSDTSAAECFDVRLHMHGRRSSPPTEGQTSVLWYFSHPAAMTKGQLRRYDLVLCASRTMTRQLRQSVEGRVEEFLQFTDTDRFRPVPDRSCATEILFVGNWRGVFRQVVWDAVQVGRDITLYGRGWDRLLPELDTRGSVEKHFLARALFQPQGAAHRPLGRYAFERLRREQDLRRLGMRSIRDL